MLFRSRGDNVITIDDKISSFQKIINEDISEKAQKEIDEYILETEEKALEA